jgi:hypothetical protein
LDEAFWCLVKGDADASIECSLQPVHLLCKLADHPCFPHMNKMVKAHQSVQIQVAADPLVGVFKPCFVLMFNRLYDLR